VERRVSRARISVLPSPAERRRVARPTGPLHGAVAQRDGITLVHLSTAADDLPRLAGALRPLADTAAFEQVVLDATGAAERVLAEFELDVPIERVGSDLREAAALRDAAALLVHSDGTAALAGALAAAREGVAVVRVGPIPRGSASALAVARLSDLVLVADVDDARVLAPRIGPERMHVIGSPLIDVVRRCSREAVFRAAWRRFGVMPGRFVLAELGHDPDAALSAPLAALAAETPLVIDASPAWRECVASAVQAGASVAEELGFVDRLSLEKAAAAIVASSARAHEEAAALGIPCHRFDELPLRAEPASLRSTVPLWDGHAGDRVADVLVANFARVRLP
jgi:UDP-N-acetylglucosamine 2-epimerase (non-hydrolysing)